MMPIKQRAISAARRLYFCVPPHYRERVVNLCFTHGGRVASSLPSYQHWLQQKHYQAMTSQGMTSAEITERMTQQRGNKPCFLLISHGRGGGTESHIKELSAALRDEGIAVWVLRMVGKTIAELRLEAEAIDPDSGALIDVSNSLSDLQTALSLLPLHHIHLHHTLEFPKSLLSWLPRFAKQINVALDITLHDYFSICPRFTLTDEYTGAYCGEPSADRCTICIYHNDSPVGRHVNVPQWRERYGELLAHARSIFVPNADVATRMKRYYPALDFTVRAHFDPTPTTLPPMIERKPNEPLHVVIIGALPPSKGSRVLLRCAQDAMKRKLPIHFTIVGYTNIDHEFSTLSNVTITGKYDPTTLQERLKALQAHVAFFPNVWPETYCYTLSEALRAGMYPATLDIGAVAERIRRMNWGSIWPLDYCTRPAHINDALLALEPGKASRPDADILQNFTEYKPFIANYYGSDIAA